MSHISAQVGLVHGAGFELCDGSQGMSACSRANAETALGLLAQGLVERVICSGRGPLDGIAYKSSEAGLMADYLLGQGIPVSRIETEDASTTTVGNWAFSAGIIQDLGIETVLGVTAKPNIRRMRTIGGFVARRADFELTGYVPSVVSGSLKDHIREAGVGLLTKAFLSRNEKTPLPELEEAYISFKNNTGVGALKRFMHRRSTEELSS